MKRGDTGRKAGDRVKTIRVVIAATLWALQALYNAFYNSSPLSQPLRERRFKDTFKIPTSHLKTYNPSYAIRISQNDTSKKEDITLINVFFISLFGNQCSG